MLASSFPTTTLGASALDRQRAAQRAVGAAARRRALPADIFRGAILI